ncbi:MAG: N-acetylneuraminate synthase family protein [Candidatus Helarchaeota archaeon]|nr:N-acetylneuraminate synthase family protein [Candidatus Helarchaeota archaeon]
MKTLEINNKKIGVGYPAFIIAEAGINHNGSLRIAKKLIDIACDAGVDVVKFQKRTLSEVYKKDIIDNPNNSEQPFQYLIPILKKFELKDSEYNEITKYCKEKGIIFMCTPWDKKSVDFLEKLNVPAYKVSSADMTNFSLIKYIVSKKKPVILSTGMWSQSEIDKTVNFLNELKANFALLQCNSTYPAPFKHLNLRFMNTLKKYGVPIGYSGHERGIAVSEAAVVAGACIIEKHFTLDRTMVGPDHAASLEPAGLIKLVRDIRNIELAMGYEKRYITRGEIVNREVLAKSIVAGRDIKKGETFTEENLKTKSPGKGISPQRIYELIGKKAQRDIKEDEYILQRDFGETKYRKVAEGLKKRWGLIVRFHDIDDVVQSNPDLLEFHLSDKDLEFDYDNSELKDKHYIQQLCVHAPEYWKDYLLDLCTKDDSVRKLSIDVYQRTINLTRKISKNFDKKTIPKIIIHPGGWSLDDPIQDRDNLIETMIESLNQLDSEGVMMLVENMPPFPWFFGGQWLSNSLIDASEVLYYCKKTGRGFCFDLSHADMYCKANNKDLYKYIELVLPYIEHFHISDSIGTDGEGLQILEGEIDFKRVLSYFKDYNKGIIPEIWLGHQNRGEGFIIAVERLNQIFKELE